MIYAKVFSILAVISGLGVCFSGDYRKSIFFLWCVGLSVSGMFLSNHAEFVALAQSISASLICIGFLVFSSSFGSSQATSGQKKQTRAFALFAATACAVVFAGALAIVEQKRLHEFAGRVSLSSEKLGDQMTASQNFLALMILVLAIFAAMVGSASVSRPETQAERGEA